MKDFEKVVRNNKVAVLISKGFGSGWSTWADSKYREILLFHPKLVKMVEDGRQDEITSEWLHENFPQITNATCCPAHNLSIEWVDKGESIIIYEYDGAESIDFVRDVAITV